MALDTFTEQKQESEKHVDCTEGREHQSDITRQWYSKYIIILQNLAYIRKATASCLKMCDEPNISAEGISHKLLCQRVRRFSFENTTLLIGWVFIIREYNRPAGRSICIFR